MAPNHVDDELEAERMRSGEQLVEITCQALTGYARSDFSVTACQSKRRVGSANTVCSIAAAGLVGRASRA